MRKFNWLILLITIAVSCNKEKEFDYPLIYIGEVTNIDSTGVEFHANIKDQSLEGIIDYGFVWGCNSTPDINSSQVKIAAPISNGILSLKITNDLIPDTCYFVRAFARNSKYITYSNVVSFISKGCLPPVIHDFSPDHGTAGTSVTIYGENFSGSVLNNILRFGNVLAKVDSASSNKLIVKIDESASISGIVNINIQVANHLIKSEKTFRLDGINIIDFTPQFLKPTDTLTLTLENFNPDPTKNIVQIGNVFAENYTIRNNTLICTVPYNAKIGDNQITITANNRTCSSNNLLTIISPWSNIKNGYKFYRAQAVAFSINGKGYVGMGEDYTSNMHYDAFNDLYEFDPTTSQWIKCPNLPSSQRQDAIGFSIGNKGYVGLGNYAGWTFYNDLWEYDPELRSWQQKASFPGETANRRNPTCLVIGDFVYFGLGQVGGYPLKDFWRYDPSLNEWTRLADCTGNGGTYVGFCVNSIGYFGFGYGSTGYSTSNQFWKYEPEKDEWTQLSDFPGNKRYSPVAFSLNGFGYIGMGGYGGFLSDFWRYYPNDDKWIRIPNINVKPRFSANSFVINDKAYLVAGFNSDGEFGSNAESIIVYQP